MWLWLLGSFRNRIYLLHYRIFDLLFTSLEKSISILVPWGFALGPLYLEGLPSLFCKYLWPSCRLLFIGTTEGFFFFPSFVSNTDRCRICSSQSPTFRISANRRLNSFAWNSDPFSCISYICLWFFLITER